MKTYRDNTPNYNTDKIVKFSEYKKDDKKVKKSITRNSQDNKIIGNPTLSYNKITGKIDSMPMAYVDDKLKSLKESVSNESLEILKKIQDYLEENPSIRFGQALFNLGINEFDTTNKRNPFLRDIYNDSDSAILNRIKKNDNN